MNLLRLALTLGLLLTSITTLPAQEVGRGRLLKRLREEISEANREREEKIKQARERTRRERERERQQEKASSNRTPTLPNPPGRPPSFAPQNRRPNPAANPYARDRSSSETRSRGISAEAGKGFGLDVEERNEKLVVTRVDPKGNAAEAGIRPGDIIVGVGGIDIESERDFEEFTKILGQGDQMEFAYVSRGRTRKANVTFGEVPEFEEGQNLAVAPGEDEALPPVIQGNSGNSVLTSSTTRSTDFPRDRTVSALQQTISRQRKEIEALREEVVRLRQQNLSNRRNRGTSLNGPGN